MLPHKRVRSRQLISQIRKLQQIGAEQEFISLQRELADAEEKVERAATRLEEAEAAWHKAHDASVLDVERVSSWRLALLQQSAELHSTEQAKAYVEAAVEVARYSHSGAVRRHKHAHEEERKAMKIHLRHAEERLLAQMSGVRFIRQERLC
jgi:hypothetical protein